MKFLSLAIFAFALSAQAEEGNFAEHKTKMLSHIEERIQKMQEHKTCVSGAADKEALKACHKDMKEWRHEHKNEMKEKREERKEKHKHKH